MIRRTRPDRPPAPQPIKKPTRPMAHAHVRGEGAQAADAMLDAKPMPGGVDTPARDGYAATHRKDSIRAMPKESSMGVPLEYGSPAHSPKHPGFKSAQSSIAKREGISKDRAGAILASAARGASKAAKKANPRLKRVKG